MFHWLKKHPYFFFSRKERRAIVGAIQAAEQLTSAEIRVHMGLSSLKTPVLDQAQRVFEKLGMARTVQHNGVLIYLCPSTKRFAIYGDIGIHEKAGFKFWSQTAAALETNFRKQEFAAGVILAVQTAGQELAKYFPRRPSDRNELSDKISS